MSDELHVLVYGTTDQGACAVYRVGMYKEALERRGVFIREFGGATVVTDPVYGDRLDLALAGGGAIMDREMLDWADVILFRRLYQTAWWKCTGCIGTAFSEAWATQHEERTGHTMTTPDALLRPLFDTFEHRADALKGRAIMYDTDDDLFGVPAWNTGTHMWMNAERDLLKRIVRRADLVTVSTPVLAEEYARYGGAIRVVRNAIDSSWYPPRPDGAGLKGDPRLLYYGSALRMRDYAVCRGAVDETRRRFPKARRIWLGATGGDAHLGPSEAAVAVVDEALPYVPEVRDFARALVYARPDIGLAPLVDEDFNRRKSELHWLEYSMAGAATVATRTSRPGPFDVIRDGVDGFLVGSRSQWRERLARLAASKPMREDLAGRARERILAEYDVETRADEWADAYRWAAEHAGCGSRERQFALGSPELADLERRARLDLVHRRRIREAADSAENRLAALRAERETCWPVEDGEGPLVSVVVPVAESPVPLVERAIRSALAQDYEPFEIIVAAAPDAHLAALISRLHDDRIKLVDVPTPLDLPAAEAWRRSALEAAALVAGTAASRGAWIAPLGPESEFTPDHISILLEAAIENRLEFIYGQATVVLEGRPPFLLGLWPPIADAVLTLGSEVYSAKLLEIAGYDGESWRELRAAPWQQWSAFVAAGVRMANAETILTTVSTWTGDDDSHAAAGD
jgi:glycosyltransferase involved in cell wall biosynthesis